MQADDSLVQEKERMGPFEISLIQEKSVLKKHLRKSNKPNHKTK
jgi:hypothetical protein